MGPEGERQKVTGCEIAAWISSGTAMLLVLKLHLLPALLSGFLVYELVHLLAPPLRIAKLQGRLARIVVVALLATAIMTSLSLLIWGGIAFFHGESGDVPALMNKMAEIIEEYREALPSWIIGYLPGDPEGIRTGIASWLQGHAGEVRTVGREAGLMLVHVLIGMVIGALLAVGQVNSSEDHKPFAAALAGRVEKFSRSFRFVVFAQVRIAAINALFTAIYLGVVLPFFGVHLPLIKVLVAITFIAGLLPVIGNVISNTAVVIVSMSNSLSAAAASLAFLLVIHKLEYFLNAKIIGSQIRAHAWELLIAMITMEAAFGLAGVIAAPIYYAYVKSELRERGLV
ncbi:MAG TPA: AI-2E family transporter [Dissulfurispiraceae bacterium]|nr:AI-2E family transporter [Dissulfurispiraceae bacterium]